MLSKDSTLPSQLRASATASGHYDSYNKRSNVVRTLIDNNFIPYNEVDPDIFINVVTDDTYFIPDDVSQNEDIQSEWIDRDTVNYNNVLQADDNDDYNVNDKYPFNLTLPVGNDFCNTDILLDDNISISSNITFDTQDDVTKLRPPPEPPPPEPPPTYENFANTMASIRSKYGTCIFNQSNILNDIDYHHKNFTHNQEDCDYYVEVNTMLSKVSPTTNNYEYNNIIFPPMINTPLPNF